MNISTVDGGGATCKVSLKSCLLSFSLYVLSQNATPVTNKDRRLFVRCKDAHLYVLEVKFRNWRLAKRKHVDAMLVCLPHCKAKFLFSNY